jgi:hypothetical protein
MNGPKLPVGLDSVARRCLPKLPLEKRCSISRSGGDVAPIARECLAAEAAQRRRFPRTASLAVAPSDDTEPATSGLIQLTRLPRYVERRARCRAPAACGRKSRWSPDRDDILPSEHFALWLMQAPINILRPHESSEQCLSGKLSHRTIRF